MPLQATSGAASYDAFGGGVPVVPKYIEDYFSTYLVTGDGTAPAVNNGIDLSTKGGLVWTKKRSAAGSHSLFDTARGANLRLISNDTAAQDSVNLSFTTTGFSNYTFDSGVTYTSWSWAKAPKFFDVVTYTGDGTSPRAISHNLGSAPGCVIVKQTNAANDWCVWHTATGNDKSASLNLTNAFATFAQRIKSVTSTTFSVGNSSTVNDSGATYVAYVFAHNAGGFGLTGTDNVISCGSFTGNTTVNLGYEPQWIMLKRVDNIGSWDMHDVMRGWPVSGDAARLRANLSDAEGQTSQIYPNATGFSTLIGSGDYIYIAIRRGPMKVPTSGTDVFLPKTRTGNGTAGTVVTGASWPMDMLWISRRTGGGAGVGGFTDIDRLRGAYLGGNNPLLRQNQEDAESTSFVAPGFVGGQTSYDLPSGSGYGLFNTNAVTYVDYLFRRAPSFFDEVCYTGTGTSSATQTHNLGVVPELIILKSRTTAYIWYVFSAYATGSDCLVLNRDFAWSGYGNPARTSTTFTVTAGTESNDSGDKYVAYLFASCAGVSKCFSYTGNGSSQTINCGFTGGARFVLIKRTDDVGDWYCWDSARGIVSGNDPHLSLNTTAAEVTSDDTIDTDSTGFVVNQVSATNVNVSSATYIGIAIA